MLLAHHDCGSESDFLKGRTNHTESVFFFQDIGEELQNKGPIFFHVSIHFHPSQQQQPKTLIYSLIKN